MHLTPRELLLGPIFNVLPRSLMQARERHGERPLRNLDFKFELPRTAFRSCHSGAVARKAWEKAFAARGEGLHASHSGTQKNYGGRR